jgi:hypothetical protein
MKILNLQLMLRCDNEQCRLCAAAHSASTPSRLLILFDVSMGSLHASALIGHSLRKFSRGARTPEFDAPMRRFGAKDRSSSAACPLSKCP